VKLHRKWRENNAVLIRAAQAKDRAESENDAREEVPGTTATGRHLSAVGERAKSPAAYQSPTGLQHRHPRSHYACTQSHTQATLFATLTPRGASLASQQQRCETRGLLFLIAAHAVLGAVVDLATVQHCSICASGVLRIRVVQNDNTASLALPFSPSVQSYMGRRYWSRPL